jgi:hypothetical protein
MLPPTLRTDIKLLQLESCLTKLFRVQHANRAFVVRLLSALGDAVFVPDEYFYHCHDATGGDELYLIQHGAVRIVKEGCCKHGAMHGGGSGDSSSGGMSSGSGSSSGSPRGSGSGSDAKTQRQTKRLQSETLRLRERRWGHVRANPKQQSASSNGNVKPDKVIAYLGAGDHFGGTFLPHCTREHSAVAHTFCDVFVLHADDWLRAMKTMPVTFSMSFDESINVRLLSNESGSSADLVEEDYAASSAAALKEDQATIDWQKIYTITTQCMSSTSATGGNASAGMSGPDQFYDGDLKSDLENEHYRQHSNSSNGSSGGASDEKQQQQPSFVVAAAETLNDSSGADDSSSIGNISSSSSDDEPLPPPPGVPLPSISLQDMANELNTLPEEDEEAAVAEEEQQQQQQASGKQETKPEPVVSIATVEEEELDTHDIVVASNNGAVELDDDGEDDDEQSALLQKEAEKYRRSMCCCCCRITDSVVIMPFSRFYRIWSRLLLVAILYQMFFLPFSFAFLREKTSVDAGVVMMYVLGCSVDFFLIADIFVSFAVAVYDDGVIKRSLYARQKHYWRTYLLWDIAASVPLDMGALLIKSLVMGFTPMVSQFYRFNRLLRIVHLPRLTASATFSARSSFSISMRQLLRLIFLLLCITRTFLSCLLLACWCIVCRSPSPLYTCHTHTHTIIDLMACGYWGFTIWEGYGLNEWLPLAAYVVCVLGILHYYILDTHSAINDTNNW